MKEVFIEDSIFKNNTGSFVGSVNYIYIYLFRLCQNFIFIKNTLQ